MFDNPLNLHSDKNKIIKIGEYKIMMNKDKNENTVTITRKYALIPTSSERKEWHKRVYNFTIEDLTRKIEYYKEKSK